MGPEKETIRPSTQGNVGRQDAADFLDRIGFARERRLVHEQIFRFKQQTIAGNRVARSEQDDIARHDLLNRHRGRASVAPHIRFDLHDREQAGHRLIRAPFLPEPEQAAGEHDHENDRRVGPIRQKEGQPRGRQEDEDDRAGELPKQQLVGGQPALRFQEKMRIAQMTPSRLIAGESFGA